MKSYKHIPLQPDLNALLLKLKEGERIVIHKNSTNFIFGWKVKKQFKVGLSHNLEDIQAFIDDNSGEYIFTAFSYDLKEKITPFMTSGNSDDIDFPLADLIVFENVLIGNKNELLYFGEVSQKEIKNLLDKPTVNTVSTYTFEFHPFLTENEYTIHFNQIQKELQFGNIYEINYCVPFQGVFRGNDYTPLTKKLIQATAAPFGAIWETANHLVICSSPERFLQKKNKKLISQPIKGTKRRGHSEVENDGLKEALRNDAKERSENIMIVDLVRNDLSRVAKKNTVKVEELCGIYSFKTVNQMISTISCEPKSNCTFTDLLASLFPMGSMTGAPKISATEISEREESFKRGIYSGSIGFIEPNGNFDLNVVIRSFNLNKKTGFFNVPVGGALTIKANAKSEYDECLLKLAGVKNNLC